MKKICSIILLGSFIMLFVAVFTEMIQLFFYDMGLISVLLSIGMYKDKKIASVLFGISGVCIISITYLHFNAAEITIKQTLYNYLLPVGLIAAFLITGTVILYKLHIKPKIQRSKYGHTTGCVTQLYTRRRFVKRGNRRVSRVFYKEEFRYLVKGKAYTVEAMHWKTTGFYKKGEGVDIYYDVNNPENVLLPVRLNIIIFGTTISFICYIVAIILIYQWIK